MPLLSQAAKKKPRAPSKKVAPKAVAPLFAVIGPNIEARIAETAVTALQEGALWIVEAKTLIVSDLH